MAAADFNILINAKSGTVLAMGEPAIRAAVESSGLRVAELCFSEPDDMQADLKRLAKSKNPLLIGGGDGTLRDSAAFLAGEDKPFGVLPFGTMNLLATDLGLTSLQVALAGYARGAEEHDMDAGFVNGEIFLCCASIGTMPQASVYREKNRLTSKLILMPQLFMFVLRNFDMHRRERVVLDVDGKMAKFRTPAAVVSANRFADSEKLTESNFKRVSLSGGELAAYVFTAHTHATHLRFIWRLIFGHWLKDPDLTEMTGHRIRMWSSHHKPLVSVDGETLRLKTPLNFTIKPGYVRVLVPLAE